MIVVPFTALAVNVRTEELKLAEGALLDTWLEEEEELVD